MYVCMYVYIYIYMCVYHDIMCIHNMYAYRHIHDACIHTYMHTCMHTYIDTQSYVGRCTGMLAELLLAVSIDWGSFSWLSSE